MIYDALGRKIDVDFVEHIVRLKRQSGSNPWPVIEAVLKAWEKTQPRQYDSYIIYLKDIKTSRKNKYAAAYDRVHGGYLRYTLDIPYTVMAMIRKIYSVEELPMDKEFFTEFAHHFPAFQVAEKL